MNWLNLNVATLDSAEFLGAEPTERATWLLLLRYCCGQENGGRIQGCKDWKSRKWEQICRVTIEEVSAACDLWEWDGDDLVVWAYPDEKEEQVRAGRRGGKKGGRPGKNPPENPQVNPPENPHQNPKGKEGKGKEEERKELEHSLSLGNSSPSEPPAFPEFPRERERDLVAVTEWVKRLFPGSPHLSRAELDAIRENAATFLDADANDRKAVEGFMRAKLPEGAAYFRPRSCKLFCESFPDVLRNSIRWAGKNGTPTKTPANAHGFK